MFFYVSTNLATTRLTNKGIIIPIIFTIIIVIINPISLFLLSFQI
jgi:hypothetical protein